LLDFARIGGKSRAGKNVVRQVTANNRYARAPAAVTDRRRRDRRQPVPNRSAGLTAMMPGHHAGNFRRLGRYAFQVAGIWQQRCPVALTESRGLGRETGTINQSLTKVADI
jgi:RNA-directed DNA polymerase